MSADDERDLLRRLEPLRLELWPVFSDPGYAAPLVGAGTQLVDPGYYLAAGNARTGGKPVVFLRVVRDLQEAIKSRYRKSSPVRGLTYFIGPACARAGLPLREEGRKGERVRAYR